MKLPPSTTMNSAECERLRVYCRLWEQLDHHRKCPWQDLVCHLSDRPEKGWLCWSAISNTIPTLRKSGGLMAMPAAGRVLLLKELYAAMGYASFDVLARAAHVHTYQVFKPLLGIGYSHMRAALGNAQHVAQVGVFGLCALACARGASLM